MMLFTLETFKSTGGIQTMTRTLAYSLNEIANQNDKQFQLWSLYDKPSDIKPSYIAAKNLVAFDGSKQAFFKRLFGQIKWPDLAIISHINLAVVGLLLKVFNPKCKVWLVAHGIEVWQRLSPVKRFLLKRCDKIVCVSTFTKKEMIRLHHVAEDKCVVLNNSLDPFFTTPQRFEKPHYLKQRYNLNDGNKVLFTLARIHHQEQYKGYDKVIELLVELKKEFPNLIYILAGKSEPAERQRIELLIAENNLTDNVIITGFINEQELADHFLLADVFVMPSSGEGFGLVLIEAAACGAQVICGNSDGSVDAIRNGELGEAVNLADISALNHSIATKLHLPLDEQQRKNLQAKCLQYFGPANYQKILSQLIFNES